MPLVQTRGAASAQGFGEFAQATPVGSANYIDDVFSTYLYTGTGASQAINNGIQIGDGYSPGATGGSGLFDGINDYLSVPTTGSVLNLSGNFTIEGYVYITGNSFSGLYGNGDFAASSQIGITVSSGGLALYIGSGSGWGLALGSTTVIPLNTWTHVAFTCSGSTFNIWINGVSAATGTYSGTRATPSATTVIGRLYANTNDYYFPGYISNFRVVNGISLYNSTFTVPSSQLTAVAGTALLCLQGATPFVDNSANALTITNNNGTTANSLGPFPFTLVPGKGGMVWLKSRSNATSNYVYDTVRGLNRLSTNLSNGNFPLTDGLSSFNSNGFSLGNDATVGQVNVSGRTYCSWTFAEQEKFFDVVTYTGNSVQGRTIAHNLGSVPGMIWVKRTNTSGNWTVYHRSTGATKFLELNLNNAVSTGADKFPIDPTSTVFSLGNDGDVNASGDTYVAYLFAHDAGGFGANGADNVISCGTFTTNGSGIIPTVNLGYEPQWILAKRTDIAQNWVLFDVMREWSMTNQRGLFPNTLGAEINFTVPYYVPSATGFYGVDNYFGVNAPVIYMAIRRPMKPPTNGTQVFNTNLETSTSNPQTLTTGFPVDLSINTVRDGNNRYVHDRLRGGSTNTVISLFTNLNSAESVGSGAGIGFDNNTAIVDNNFWLSTSAVFWNFRRAPGFFDEVCYNGNSGSALSHNLGVAPELIFIKRRNGSAVSGVVYSAALGLSQYVLLFSDVGANAAGSLSWMTSVSSTAFQPTDNAQWNGASTNTYVAYLFASVTGVSKVGSYTGTGATQTINCGFTAGARFVLIKRTDSTGDWYVWDTARGMVSGTDPSLLLNSTAAEVNANSVYTATTGFQIVSTAAGINASGGTYIFLAIA